MIKVKIHKQDKHHKPLDNSKEISIHKAKFRRYISKKKKSKK